RGEVVAWRGVASASASASDPSGGRTATGIGSRVLEYLKKQYLEASKMQPPP
ncbi:hypothetical protein KI387_005893, partial [Taxus chinensis]